MNLDESIRVQCFLNEAIFQVAADAGLIFFTFKEPRRTVKRICSGQIRRTHKALKKKKYTPVRSSRNTFSPVFVNAKTNYPSQIIFLKPYSQPQPQPKFSWEGKEITSHNSLYKIYSHDRWGSRFHP